MSLMMLANTVIEEDEGFRCAMNECKEWGHGDDIDNSDGELTLCFCIGWNKAMKQERDNGDKAYAIIRLTHIPLYHNIIICKNCFYLQLLE